MTIAPLTGARAPAITALLAELHVSLFGVASRRLHAALVRDALRHAVDVRIALDRDRVCGVVLAAPASYWRLALLRHVMLGYDCLLARLRRARRTNPTPDIRSDPARDARLPGLTCSPGVPPRTWANPGDAWRIIFVGAAPAARGRGVGSALYRSVMADRSLVARIAADNAASIGLHQSLGWALYRDGSGLLAVHLREWSAIRQPPASAAPAAREAVR